MLKFLLPNEMKLNTPFDNIRLKSNSTTKKQ